MLRETETIVDRLWPVQGGSAGASKHFLDMPNVLLTCWQQRLTLPDSGTGLSDYFDPPGGNRQVLRGRELAYPRTPGWLQGVIALTLLDMGCGCEDVQRQNCFFLPARG